MTSRVQVGVIGTSWWADAMFLPALSAHPHAEVVAVCGRDAGRAQAFAQRWSVPAAYTDTDALLDHGGLEAVLILTPNYLHHPLTLAALARGLHVLCEKPLALNVAQAREMLAAAEAAGVRHMVPYTYSFMPTTRYLRELIEQGYIGRPYHLNLRYYSGYARTGEYLWRFDRSEAGSGVLGDLGSHFLFVAMQIFGEVEAVQCHLAQLQERGPRPDGKVYEQVDDSALLTLKFSNGAHGIIHVSSMSYEDTPFGQTHHMEFHGSEGTLHSFTDWDRVQQVSGARVGEGAVRPLEIPDHIWQGLRRDTVHNSYRDTFRQNDYMARGFITAIREQRPASPDFRDGLQVQRVLAAAELGAAQGRKVTLREIE